MNRPATASTRSLSRRLVRLTAAILLLLLAGLAWAGSRLLRDRVLRQSNTGLLQAAEEAALIIDRVVAERERQVRLLASLPSVVDAAKAGSALAARVGLPGLPLDEAERRFEATRTLDVDLRTRGFLLDRAASLDLAEVLVTDRNGFNAITTERTSDFVQSDEVWWQEAMRTGMSRAVAAYDESARRVSISVASAVREGDSTVALGVLKVVYGLAALQEAVRSAGNQGAIAVEVVDSAGRVIASSATEPDLKPLPGQQEIAGTSASRVVRYKAGGNQRAAVRMTNASAWRVVAHTPESLVTAELRQANLVLGLAALGVFMLLLGVLAAMNTFMTRRIAAPAAALAAAAESVAGGDLSVRLMESTADDEIGRLSRATSAMIGGLRNLTVAIKRLGIGHRRHGARPHRELRGDVSLLPANGPDRDRPFQAVGRHGQNHSGNGRGFPADGRALQRTGRRRERRGAAQSAVARAGPGESRAPQRQRTASSKRWWRRRIRE